MSSQTTASTNRGGPTSVDLVSRVQIHMGTEIMVALPSVDLSLSEGAFGVFVDFDRRLSTYKSGSEISRLNRWGHLEVSPLTLAALQEALQVARETKGLFDPTIGVLSEELYRFQRQSERVPQPTELKAALRRIDYSKVQIQGREVSLPKGFRLDFGGIAKGQAVEAAARCLDSNAQKRGRSLESGIVAASGDIFCWHACEVVIRHPLREGQEWARFRLRQGRMAISTSGVSERKIRGTLKNHLLNPRTGLSENQFYSVTLIAGSTGDGTAGSTGDGVAPGLRGGRNGWLDGLTTAVSLMSLGEALEFLRARPQIKYILLTAQGEAWISADQEGWSSDWRLSYANDFRIRQATQP